MNLTLTYLGHSAFLLDDGNRRLVVDPFLTGNPTADRGPDAIDCQHIALTHGHADHVGDTMAIAQRTGAEVVACFELCEWIRGQGHENVNPGNPGGKVPTEFGWIAFTQAFHSSSYEGVYLGQPCGLMIHMAGKTVYHCGDTGLFSDMRLLGEIYRPDLALIPIGDRFTMGPELATRAAEMIGAPRAIPIHFDTWPPIAQDPSHFVPDGVEVTVLKTGQTFEL